MSAIADAAASMNEHAKGCHRCRSEKRCPEMRRLAKEFMRILREKATS